MATTTDATTAATHSEASLAQDHFYAEKNADLEHCFDSAETALFYSHSSPEKVRALSWLKWLEMEHSQQHVEMLVTGDSLSSSSSLASLASSSDAPSSLTAGGGGYFYKQIRGEVSRYCKARQTIFSDPVVQKQIEFCVSAYLSNHHCRDFTPALVPLCGPFIYVFQHESLALLAYTRMLDMMDEWLSVHSLDHQVSNFMVLLRSLQPDLLSHFEEEEVDLRRLVAPWFETLLSKQLPIDCILRLWDQYISSAGLELHVYTCLAILQFYKEDLEELEQSEIQSFFFSLPQSFKVEPILVLANQISFQFKSSNDGSF